jgi:cobalt-zinc-cadmium efflux system membrane fusion protein
MHIKKLFITGLFVLSVLLTATTCDRKGNTGTDFSEIDTAGGMLRLTPDQIEQAGIETGRMEYRNMEGLLECTGVMEAQPENIADVTAPVGGLVKSCPFHSGDYVSTGQTIAVLEHPDYIKIQQDFLETKSQWDYYREDFKRQGELTVENASSIKTMQQAQASFRATEVRLFALRSQLKLLGIDADSLNIGNISSTVTLSAPISGYITEMKINLGKYVGPDLMACRIVNKNNLCLRLSVNEKDIRWIKSGQDITFLLTSDPAATYSARVISLSPAMEPSDEAFHIRAGIMEFRPWFNPGMKVNASIRTAGHSCLTLPLSAIVFKAHNTLIFLHTAGGYRPVAIKTGLSDDSRIEVKEFPAGLTDSILVTKGVSYLNEILFHLQP